MKRARSLFIVLSVFLLCACDVFSAKEAEVGFLDDAFLAECKLTGMPTPDDTDIRHDENTVYCNMTEEKRIEFANELASYLMAKDDIYYKGYYYETGCVGGIFFLPEYRFAPLTADANYGGWFAFSLTESLNEGEEYNYNYWNGVTVSVSQKDGKIGSYSYNTVIEIDSDPNGIVYQVPEHEHTGEMHTSEYAHWFVYTCGCPSPDIAELHSDYDENNVCDLCGYVMAGHEHTREFRSNEYAHWYVYTCGCETPDNSAKHSDTDENDVCDVCEYIMPEHQHTWELRVDEICHCTVYTCGCLTPPNATLHFDNDGDGKCDVCGYNVSQKVSHSINYQSDRTAEFLMDGFAPAQAKSGDTVVLRTHPIMDADLAFYANGVRLTQTHSDSDYWEYVFIMPDEDVVITHDIIGGF